MIKKISIFIFITFYVISCTTNPGNSTEMETGINAQIPAELVENEELGMLSEELGMLNEELGENVELGMSSEELGENVELGMLNDELEENDDTKEQIAELNNKIDTLTELVTQLLEQTRQQETHPAQVTTPDAETAPAVLTAPLPEPVQTPTPVLMPQPPAEITQPVLPDENIDEIVSEEDADESTEEETFYVYKPEFPPAPAARIESLTQMGEHPQDKEINFSRIVYATAGQILEIPFRGNGWVYLGEIASRRGIIYNSRRSDQDGLSFIFNLEEAGVYTLKFYKQDFLRDYILNDHVQVIVSQAPPVSTGWFNPQFDRGRVVAQPRWPTAMEEAQIRSGAKPVSAPVVSGTPPSSANQATPAPPQTESTTPAPSQNTASTQGQSTTSNQPAAAPSQTTAPSQPAAQTTPVILNTSSPSQTTSQPLADDLPEVPQITDNAQLPAQESQPARQRIPGTEGLSPNAMIQRAQSAFDGGNAAAAIALLDQYMYDFPGGSDEVYWMYGQFYEANTPARNILLSIDYYRRLMNEYPQSRRFNDARRRVAYLERFYINIQ